jgi:hypothetical protein
MNAILGFAQLSELNEGRSPPRRKNGSGKLRKGQHLLDLINKIWTSADRSDLSVSEPVRCESIQEVVDLPPRR